MRLSVLTVGAVAISGLTIAGLKPLTASASVDDKVFTHEFRNAAPADVLAWMKKEGLRVDIDETMLPMRTLNLVFSGADAEGVVSSFAKTIGFQAEKRGDVYSLMRGVSAVPSGEGEWSDQDAKAAVPHVSVTTDSMVQERGILEEVLEVLKEAGVSEQLRDKVAARLEKRLSERRFKFDRVAPRVFAMPHLESVPEIDEMDIEIPEMDFDFDFDFDESMGQQKGVVEALMQAREAIDRAMAELHGKGMMAPHMKDKMSLHGMQGEEMKRHMAEMEKRMAEGGKFKFHAMEGEEMKKHMAEMEKHMQELHKQFGEKGAFKFHIKDFDKEFGEGMKVLKIKMENIKKFVKSLTKEQKARAEKQGYLRPEDLTKEQRELLGVKEGDKDFDMNFNMDGDSIRIKSGKGEVKKTSVGLGA